jgi:hypothetical protein
MIIKAIGAKEMFHREHRTKKGLSTTLRYVSYLRGMEERRSTSKP